MLIFDISLIVIIAGFVFYGLFFGLIRTLGSLIGVIGGLWLTFVFYLEAFDWVKNLFFGHDLTGKITTFLVLFVIFNRLIGLAFALIDRTFDLISIIPFLKTINRLGGSVLGFLESGFVLGLLLMFLSQTVFGSWLNNSQVAPFLIKFVKTVLPLLPGLLDKIMQKV